MCGSVCCAEKEMFSKVIMILVLHFYSLSQHATSMCISLQASALCIEMTLKMSTQQDY